MFEAIELSLYRSNTFKSQFNWNASLFEDFDLLPQASSEHIKIYL